MMKEVNSGQRTADSDANLRAACLLPAENS
jgi:hypothetical protein